MSMESVVRKRSKTVRKEKITVYVSPEAKAIYNEHQKSESEFDAHATAAESVELAMKALAKASKGR